MQGWKEVELGDVAEFINGRAFKPSEWERKGKIIIRIQDLTGNIENPNFTTQTFDNRYLVKKGDLLISWSATLDAFIWNKEEGWLNQHIFKVVENKNLIDRKFLFYLVKNKIEDLKKETHGSTMKHITKGNFNSIKFYLPPLQVQKHIVSILEKAGELIRKRGDANNLTKEYLQSVFYEMFSNKKFDEVILRELCLLITKGTTPTTYGHSFIDKGINFLKIENIDKDGKILMNSLQFISKEANELLKRSQLVENDIIFSIAGALGRVAIIKKEYLPANINQAIAIIRLKSDKKINKEYLEYYLRSEIVIKQTTENKRGVAQLNLNLEQIGNINVILPPLGLQQKFASIVEHVEKIKEKQKQSKGEINTMFDSLMKQAFNGELVK